jgi:hypothetical protein
MSLPRYCKYADENRKHWRTSRLVEHVHYCKECQQLNAAAGLAEAHEVYGRMHEWRKENRDKKAARKRQDKARKGQRSKK